MRQYSNSVKLSLFSFPKQTPENKPIEAKLKWEDNTKRYDIHPINM